MNNPPPPPPFSPGEQQRPRSSSERRSEEFQRNGGPRPMHNNRGLQSPDGHGQIANGATRRPFGRPPFPHFEGPRSPPNPKNTRHVPCKFFRTEGGCQAGHQCPFLHSMDDTTTDTPCKYFAKGNCKFGPKCALAHILPDGRRVNRPYPNGMASTNMGAGALSNQLHQRVPAPFQNGPPHQNGMADPYIAMGMANSGDYLVASQLAPQPYTQVPTIETGYTSYPDSQYGSPPENNHHPFSSPTAAGYLSVLDAPMPASFDSQGISEMARYGPIAASMPSKVFIESPPSSLPRKIIQPSDALRKVHDVTYNRDLRTTRAPPDLGSSPSVTSGDEGAPPLPPHRKHLQRSLNPHQYNNSISKSLPRGPTTSSVNEDWIAEDLLFGNEEDLVPGSLQELLTPQERIRRVSRTEKDRSSVREAFSGLGIPGAGADQTHPGTKFGSPSGASPSRYGALFARQREEEATAARAKSINTGEGGANMNGPSPFGHVGSPLRNSSLHSYYTFGESRQQPLFPQVSEPTRNINGNGNLESLPDPSSASALSHQFSHTHLASSPPAQYHQKPYPNGDLTTSTRQPSIQHPAPPPPAPPSYSSILSKSTASSSSSKTLTPPVNPSSTIITTATTAAAPNPGTTRGPQKQQSHSRPLQPPRKLSGPEARIEEEGRLGSEGGVFSMEADDDDDDPLPVTAPLPPSVAVPARKSIWNS